MKVPLTNCKKCGALFKKKKRNICDNCITKERELVEKISKYVEDYPEPTLTLQLISEGLEVNLADIEEIYVNSLLLTYVTNKIIVTCKICGNEFKGSDMKGHFCAECLDREGFGGFDPTKIKVELKQFHKDVMHTRRASADQFGLGRGFKSKRD